MAGPEAVEVEGEASHEAACKRVGEGRSSGKSSISGFWLILAEETLLPRVKLGGRSGATRESVGRLIRWRRIARSSRQIWLYL